MPVRRKCGNSLKEKHPLKVSIDKKVLLRERKRHTDRRVASTPYVVLTGYPPSQGTPPARVPPLARVPPGQGTPRPGYPQPGTPWPGYPPGQGTPPARVPPARVPPLAGPGRLLPQLPHGILGNVAKHYGIWVPPPCGQTDWWMDGRTDACQNITFPSYYVRGR